MMRTVKTEHGLLNKLGDLHRRGDRVIMLPFGGLIGSDLQGSSQVVLNLDSIAGTSMLDAAPPYCVHASWR